MQECVDGEPLFARAPTAHDSIDAQGVETLDLGGGYVNDLITM